MNLLTLIIAAIATGAGGFLIYGKVLDVELAFGGFYATAIAAVVGLCLFIFLRNRSGQENSDLPPGAVAVAVLIAAGTAMALTALRQLTAYISLPVDLLSFSESPFVNDIIKFRMGVPVYTSPQDNNSYPYTPGTQILTYLISAALGHGDSIAFYRIVQFSYVVLAAIVATSVCGLLARTVLSTAEYRHRPLWFCVWFLFLFLVSIDSRFNPYNHSLHNDGLALLVSAAAYWLMVKHAIAPRRWLLGAMAVLPAVGFLVKQNQLMWAGIFFIYLMTSSAVSWRSLWIYLLGSVVFVAIVVGGCYLLWGDQFLYWIFRALGDKQVSLLRSILHLAQAGVYLLMGLFGGWVLALRARSRKLTALWFCWLVVFGIEAYSSGIGWQANHLGPGIMIAACWFFVALIKIWPGAESLRLQQHRRAQEAIAVGLVIAIFGALGFAKSPRNPVPADFFRYVADVEEEFRGYAPEKVLMDTGTWIYLRENILMKDRSAPVSVHTGKNQPEINKTALAATIKRIEQKTYDKILVRQLDTGHTWYDYQDRGSGVKAALLANYHEVRRIPGVSGIKRWWPDHLVAEIQVLVPNHEESESRLILR